MKIIERIQELIVVCDMLKKQDDLPTAIRTSAHGAEVALRRLELEINTGGNADAVPMVERY